MKLFCCEYLRMNLFLILCGLLMVLTEVQLEKKVICYWDSFWSKLEINPHICTHVIYGYIEVSSTGDIIGPTENEIQTKPKLLELRTENPEVKLMAAFGGFDASVYSQVASHNYTRNNLARNTVAFLESNRLDGVDINWQNPSELDNKSFVLLLIELRRQLTASGYILSITVSFEGGESYNIPKIHPQVDFINLKTFRLNNKSKNMTAHISPLFNDPNAVEVKVRYWIQQGAPRIKLILGITAYGILFSLTDANTNTVGAPIDNQELILPYSSLCTYGWHQVWSDEQQVPYVFSGNKWVSFDDIDSARAKANYAKEQHLGGAAIWSIEFDDATGKCGEGNFPLTNVIYSTIMNDNEYEEKQSSISNLNKIQKSEL